MAKSNLLKYQITIKVNNSTIRFHNCNIRTGTEGPVCDTAIFEDTKIKVADPVTVDLSWMENKSEIVFTGYVCKIYKSENKKHFLALSSDYKLESVPAATGWENAYIKDIIIDVLNNCGITDFNLDYCPGEKLKWFSYYQLTGRNILHKLIYCLEKSFNLENIFFFFDNFNIFQFGGMEDTRINHLRIDIETGINLIKTEKNHYETFALPIQFNQVLYFDNQQVVCTGSHFVLSPGKNRIEFEVAPL